MSEYTEQEEALKKRKCKMCNGIGTTMVGFEDEPCSGCNETGFATNPFHAWWANEAKFDIKVLSADHSYEEVFKLAKNAFKAGQKAGE